jgi:hypothetical protein
MNFLYIFYIECAIIYLHIKFELYVKIVKIEIKR